MKRRQGKVALEAGYQHRHPVRNHYVCGGEDSTAAGASACGAVNRTEPHCFLLSLAPEVNGSALRGIVLDPSTPSVFVVPRTERTLDDLFHTLPVSHARSRGYRNSGTWARQVSLVRWPDLGRVDEEGPLLDHVSAFA